MAGQNLTALTVQKEKVEGRYSDGGGLYLQVTKARTKSWLFRYMRNGKARVMGLGSVDVVSLSQARVKAADCRKQLLEDIDPLEITRRKKAQAALDEAGRINFSVCAEQYIEAHESGWTNRKHVDQWRNTIRDYVLPVMGEHLVHEIDTQIVLRALRPHWSNKTETMNRVRQRIEAILDWARASGYRDGANPAIWKGHLANLLPRKSKISPTKHHPALPINDIYKFVQELRSQIGIAPLALEFLILTATRTGEVLNAKWSEFNLKERIWIIPAERMKAKREHRVPLTSRALEILSSVKQLSDGDFVFPGRETNKPLSNMSMLVLLRRMDYKVVSHGFRSTFRDWSAEYTSHPSFVCEMALAHTVRDAVERAYRRGDLFEKRRKLMDDWAKFISTKSDLSGKVVAFKKKRHP